MPSDERATKSAERCSLHPGSPAVDLCDSCGRALCLACAVPVRGRVLGAECLAEALGPDAPAEPPSAERERNGRRTLSGAAFVVAVLSTALPWSTFGEGSGPLGAWGRSPRWSTLAAGAAVAGLVLWLVGRRRVPASPAVDAVMAVLGAVVAVGALLASVRPPYAAHASLVPWIAVVAGVGAGVGAWSACREHLRRNAQRG